MANKVHAVVNGFNERAKYYGQPDRLTTQDIFAVLEFYNRKSCKSQLPTTHIDHVIPLSQGGPNTRSNLQLLTESENKQKGDSVADYRNSNVCPDDFIPQESSNNNYNNDNDDDSFSNAKRGNNGNHGAKGRSGRKPFEVTVLKRRLVENKIEEAEASFAYIVAVRDNPDEPSAQRLAAAESILDRVLGKPAIIQPDKGDELYKRYASLARTLVLGDNGLPETGTEQGFKLVFDRLQAAASTDTDPLVA